MSRTEILASLNEIFSGIFDEEVNLTERTTAGDVEGWDSVNHIRILVAVEKAFKIRLTPAEIMALKDVGDFVSLIESKTI